MLDHDAGAVPKVEELGLLPCTVKIPAAWEDDFERTGLAPSLPGCKRRHPRIRCRHKSNLVALEHAQSLPSLPREQAWFAVYLCDIGRGGIGLLHGEPLYPRERMRVAMSDNKCRVIEVVRCVRIDDCCYSIGMQFVK